MKIIILMFFTVMLTLISCGESDNKKEDNNICELNQTICVNDTTIKTCIASDDGNLWQETSCLDDRICENNNDGIASCNKPNLCGEENCENSQGCTDGGNECKNNTNGKNICNTNDYMGECAVCFPSNTNKCHDNKLKKCVHGDTEADANWIVVEDCQNGCDIENNSCK